MDIFGCFINFAKRGSCGSRAGAIHLKGKGVHGGNRSVFPHDLKLHVSSAMSTGHSGFFLLLRDLGDGDFEREEHGSNGCGIL